MHHANESDQLTPAPFCMCLDCGMKPEYPERTHAGAGRTCKVHTETTWAQELNPGPSRGEATVLTTAPLCRLHCQIKQHKQNKKSEMYSSIKSHASTQTQTCIISVSCSLTCSLSHTHTHTHTLANTPARTRGNRLSPNQWLWLDWEKDFTQGSR